MEKKPLLSIKNIKNYFYNYEGVVKALEGINLDICEGETVGLVGETGCGKSVTALSVMQLIPDPPGKIIGGQIFFEGENLLEKSVKDMQYIRGNEISMIFQDPMTSLNPTMTIGKQIMESILQHRKVKRAIAKAEVLELLDLVGIENQIKRCKN